MDGQETYELKEGQVAAIARALAEPRRFAMLRQIAQFSEPQLCYQLAAGCDISAPTIFHHMKELEASGLIEMQREGKFSYVHFRRAVFQAYLKELAENFAAAP